MSVARSMLSQTRLSPMAGRAVAALVLTVSLLWVTVSAGPAVDVWAARGLSIDRQINANEGHPLGTRSVLLRGAVTRFNAARGGRGHKGTTVYIPCDQHLSKTVINELSQAPVNGMLVALCDHDTHNEQLLSLFFASSTVTFPVYAVEEESHAVPVGANAIERVVAEAEASSTSYVVISVGKSLRHSPPFMNGTVSCHVLTSNLLVRPRDASVEAAARRQSAGPRVLVTANVDTLGFAPSTHTTGGSSGAAAAVEVFRRHALMAAAASTKDSAPASSPHGMTLLLGTGARLNYATTAQWLQARKDAEMDRYRLIISLDELLPVSTGGGGAAVGPLYMHAQDTFMRREDGKALAELAQRVAAQSGLELKVQAARTDYQHYDLRFEHEIFANRQLPAVTFSVYRSTPVDQIFRGARQSIDAAAVAVLAKRVNFIESFVSALLELDSHTASSEWVGAESYLAGLLHSAASTIRSPVSLEGKPLSAYVETLAQHLRHIDAAARTVAEGGANVVSASTTVQAMHVRPTGLRLWGPYEEHMKLFVAKTVASELVTFVLVGLLLAYLGIGEFGVGGSARVVLGQQNVK